MPYQNEISRSAEALPIHNLTAIYRRRGLVEAQESEDAVMTGMTRSLDRRLLALNLPRIEPQRQRFRKAKFA